MPEPSACGFPDETNTGVQPGVRLERMHGEVTLDRDGQVFENKLVTGTLVVDAKNVTIRNVKLIATDSYYAIKAFAHGTAAGRVKNLVLDHVEIDLNGNLGSHGIAFDNYTMRHAYIHNGADCAALEDNVVIEDSFCTLGPDANNDGWAEGDKWCSTPFHLDGFQSDGGTDLVLRHNTVRNPCGQDSAILMSTNTAPISNVVIDDNLLAGGGYTVYCGTTGGGVAAHEQFTNNVISHIYFRHAGAFGPTTWCNKVAKGGGNVRDGSAGGRYPLARGRARHVTHLALRRQLGRRYTRRRRRARVRCRRRSRSAIACRVSWWSKPRGDGRYHRYRGRVIVKRVARHRWRYSLHVRGWSRSCHCSRVVKRHHRL